MDLIYRFLALVMAVVMSFTGWTSAPAQIRQGGKAPLQSDAPSPTAPTAAGRELETDYFPAVSHTELSLDALQLQLASQPDEAALLAELDRLRALARDGTKAAEAAEGYLALLEQYSLADSALTLATLRSDQDVLDTAAAQEVLRQQGTLETLYDALCLLGQELLDSPCGETLEEALGRDNAAFLKSYDSALYGPSSYSGDIAALCQEYDQAMAQDFSAEYDGQVWTWERLSTEGAALPDTDYYAIYDLLYEAQDAVVGPIFLELVELRTAMAREAGYDSYLDYAYDWDYSRDYSPE